MATLPKNMWEDRGSRDLDRLLRLQGRISWPVASILVSPESVVTPGRRKISTAFVQAQILQETFLRRLPFVV